ncbi:hypothetical protein S245_024887, partial [Arachis hypogaea]
SPTVTSSEMLSTVTGQEAAVRHCRHLAHAVPLLLHAAVSPPCCTAAFPPCCTATSPPRCAVASPSPLKPAKFRR